MKGEQTLSILLRLFIALVTIFFIFFVIHEYHKNISVLNENESLISESAKSRLIVNMEASMPTEYSPKEVGEYSWVKTKPEERWYKQGVQVFPWVRTINQQETFAAKPGWFDIWGAVDSLDDAGLLNSERLKLLVAVKEALSNNSNKKNITSAFNAFMQHKNAHILSPYEEVAFSLKLIELGIEQHWNKAIVEAFLLTGGPRENAIVRPVVDWIFDFQQLFSQHEFDWVLGEVKSLLEQVNLSSYFLDDYIRYLYSETPDLPARSKNNLMLHNGFLVKYFENGVAVAKPVGLEAELERVKQEFMLLGVLQSEDKLLLKKRADGEIVSSIQVEVDKQFLTQSRQAQRFFLAVKVVVLLGFLGLILLLLRLQERHQSKQREVVQLKEDFVKLVGHELKTPLSGIRAMAETLQKRAERGLALDDYSERIVQESDKLWHIVDNILNFNRMSGSCDLDLNKISLRGLCDSVAQDVSSSSEKIYRFQNKIPDDVVKYLDIELFSLVIKNLLVNADLYNVNPCTEIEFSFSENTLKVADNGIGINTKDFEKVFEPFVRLPQAMRKSGTGIGLALCRKIVEMHQANIAIHRSNTTGTTWHITFHEER